MKSIGIDLGGTKMELQIFGDSWETVTRKRVPTPSVYQDLVSELGALICWADAETNEKLPIGIGAAGLVNPETGLATTANLCASGKPLPSDIEREIGRPVTYVNDCRALALSEAVFGKGRGHNCVMSLIMGTGLGGGVAIDGHLLEGPTQTGGEFGHTSAPAHLIHQYGLPIFDCGCGRTGCIESYVSGTGMSRIAEFVMGEAVSPPEIVQRRASDPKAQKVWDIWCEMSADLIHSLTVTVDPDVIVLGGGLSNISGIIEALSSAARRAQITSFGTPPIVLAQGGDTSGARGAAYAASLAVTDG